MSNDSQYSFYFNIIIINKIFINTIYFFKTKQKPSEKGEESHKRHCKKKQTNTEMCHQIELNNKKRSERFFCVSINQDKRHT